MKRRSSACWRWRWGRRHRLDRAYKIYANQMQAFGVPCGVYWIDRPWGLGARWGYDDFEIDPVRLPNFAEMVKWLNQNRMQMLLWIAPFYQGKMMDEALAKGYNLAGQERPSNGNNYPMVDLTNPLAKKYWQDGIANC